MREVNINNFSIRIFESIGKDAFILASGNLNHHNCMTVGWASLGYLWRRPIAFVYVRPQRYTYQFMEKYDYFSLNFFKQEFNDVLQLCGTQSGRDINKMKLERITPVDYEGKAIYYNEAKTVVLCKKIFFQDIDPKNLLDNSVLNFYPFNDFHRIYYGEVIKIYEK